MGMDRRCAGRDSGAAMGVADAAGAACVVLSAASVSEPRRAAPAV